MLCLNTNQLCDDERCYCEQPPRWEPRVKDLSNEEYNGFPFSTEEMILKQVNKDEARWYKNETPELPTHYPKYEKRESVGIRNLLREILV